MIKCKSTVLTLIFTLVYKVLVAQTCPEGNLIFRTQAEINNFGNHYPNCNQINGSVLIEESIFNDISDLKGLSSVICIQKSLTIKYNHHLGILLGLDALQEVKGDLNITSNDELNNITSLKSLKKVGGKFQLESNPLLSKLKGLDSLQSIGGSFYIASLPILKNLYGLERLSFIGANLEITRNDMLDSLVGLSSLERVGYIFYVFKNPVLKTLKGLNSLSKVDEETAISDNNMLVTLSGLNQLRSTGKLSVEYSQSLTSFEGLEKLDTVSGGIVISDNKLLNSVESLKNVKYFRGDINLAACPALKSISALNNITNYEINDVFIGSCANLSLCNAKMICEYLTIPENQANILGNASGCATRNQIVASCEAITNISADQNLQTSTIHIIGDEIRIEHPENIRGDISIYNINGRLVHQFSSSTESMDISNFNAGIYLIRAQQKNSSIINFKWVYSKGFFE